MTQLWRKLSRTAPGALFVRAIVFFATAAGVWIAAPTAFVSPRLLTPMLVAGLVAALVPQGRVVGVVMAGIVGLWVISTLVFGEEASVTRTFATACALYVIHTGAALAAALPYDAIVDNQVIIRWGARGVLVIVASAVLTAIVVFMAQRLTPTTSILALLAGLGVVASVVALLGKASGLRKQ